MARNFDRASGHWIDTTGVPDFTTTFSLSCWLRVSQTIVGGEFFTIFSKYRTGVGGTDRNIHMDYRVISGVANLTFNWTQPASTFILYRTGTTPLVVGAWTQIVWTADWTTNPDQVFAYKNGVSQTVNLDGSNNATPTTTATQVAEIGRFGGSAWPGDIAELAIWPIVLTAGEAIALGKGYSPMVVHPTDLVLYAPLIRDIFDYTGQVTLTNQGTTAANHPPVIYAG